VASSFLKEERPNAMDTTPGRVKVQAALTEEERAKLMAAGKCFHCRKQGHMSRACPEHQAQARSAPLEEEGSEDEFVQAMTSKPKKVAKKQTAKDIIRLIQGADDDIKDEVIQEVFMKEDF
jgi:cell division protein FtsN